jgi:hypothetical protein
LDEWKELLLYVVLQGGDFEPFDGGAWGIDLGNGVVTMVTRRPINPTELAQLIAALIEVGMVWPPKWRRS